ncbi:MAG: 5'-methylthioadenosine/adenosylhomocysteine nucleosidase [Polaromonas sp.]|jgi:adenosylhomocysteine nucleosidase|nr:5'-methylthioadenosine/adenosylhomocysteine nucleosidase [Polaromonas sp.]
MNAATRPSLTAILSALPEEQQGLLEQLVGAQKQTVAGRDFWLGQLHGQPVALGLSRIGKVSATLTAAVLIGHFGVSRMLFTGVAGGLAQGVKVGDVVVAHDFIQHDLDVSPLFPRYEVPLYGRSRFPCDPSLTALLALAAGRALTTAPDTTSPIVAGAQVHLGLIASGDRFVSSADESSRLQAALEGAGHAALAVEMEGAAVAQVCADYGVAFAAMRTISDRADNSAHIDFSTFVAEVASLYAQRIMGELLQSLPAPT